MVPHSEKAPAIPEVTLQIYSSETWYLWLRVELISGSSKGEDIPAEHPFNSKPNIIISTAAFYPRREEGPRKKREIT